MGGVLAMTVLVPASCAGYGIGTGQVGFAEECFIGSFGIAALGSGVVLDCTGVCCGLPVFVGRGGMAFGAILGAGAGFFGRVLRYTLVTRSVRRTTTWFRTS